MIDLPNKCWCTEFSVIPKDWNQPGAYKTDSWYITYKFFDPLFESRYPDGKRIEITKGINKKKTLEAKRKAIKDVMEETRRKLKKGFNPITKRTLSPDQYYNKPPKEFPAPVSKPEDQFVLHNDDQMVSITPDLMTVAAKVANEMEERMYAIPKASNNLSIITLHADMLFIDALWGAFRQIRGVPNHLNDVRSCIRAIHRAAFILNYHQVPISKITTQALLHCLQLIAHINPKFSDNRRNRFKAYLGILFSKLLIPGAVHQNIAHVIPVIPTMQAERIVPTEDEIARIDRYLKERDYCFWRFVNIFFASGARISELVTVKYGDVDLVKQEFKVHVKKGRRKKIKPYYMKPIPVSVLYLWRQVMNDCEEYGASIGIPGKVDDVVLFSVSVKPALFSIAPLALTKRWRKYVKIELGIDKRLYVLKHLYSDRIEENYTIGHAQHQNSHESSKTTEIYTLSRDKRRAEELKRVTIGLRSSSNEAQSTRHTMVSKRVARLDAIWPVSAASTKVFSKLVDQMRNRNEMTLSSPSYFSLRLSRLQNDIQTTEGWANVYGLSQGIQISQAWVTINKMEFLYIPDQDDADKQVHFSEVVYPISVQQQWLSVDWVCIQVMNGQIHNIDTALAPQLTEIADKWLAAIQQYYLPDIPSPGEGIAT